MKNILVMLAIAVSAVACNQTEEVVEETTFETVVEDSTVVFDEVVTEGELSSEVE
jgi:hypothetical protein